MMKILVCHVWAQRNIAAFVVNFDCATNAQNNKIPGWKGGMFVAYCVPCSKEPSSKAHSTQHMLLEEKILLQFLVLKLHFYCFVNEKTCSILSLRVLIIYA